jgi:hypothetical protein
VAWITSFIAQEYQDTLKIWIFWGGDHPLRELNSDSHRLADADIMAKVKGEDNLGVNSKQAFLWLSATRSRSVAI